MAAHRRLCGLPFKRCCWDRSIPGGAYLASLLFGFFDALQLKLQLFSDKINIPPQFFLAFPYILTVLVLAGVVGRAVAPAAVGKPYKAKG